MSRARRRCAAPILRARARRHPSARTRSATPGSWASAATSVERQSLGARRQALQHDDFAVAIGDDAGKAVRLPVDEPCARVVRVEPQWRAAKPRAPRRRAKNASSIGDVRKRPHARADLRDGRPRGTRERARRRRHARRPSRRIPECPRRDRPHRRRSRDDAGAGNGRAPGFTTNDGLAGARRRHARRPSRARHRTGGRSRT